MMGFGSIITRALISGAVRAAADITRERARIKRANQPTKPLRETASVATKEVSLPTTVISGPKALRLIAIIDGLLEQTRDEWLPSFRASLGADSPSSNKVQEDMSLRKVRSHLMQMGFPYDWEFSVLVSDIHLELQVHKAMPEAWKEWNQDLDDLLERTAGEAKRMARERRMETLAKVMTDGRLPTDDYVLAERLMPVAREITEIVIVPALTRTGLRENNVVFGVRLGKLIGDIVIRDFIEWAGELAQQSDVT